MQDTVFLLTGAIQEEAGSLLFQLSIMPSVTGALIHTKAHGVCFSCPWRLHEDAE